MAARSGFGTQRLLAAPKRLLLLLLLRLHQIHLTGGLGNGGNLIEIKLALRETLQRLVSCQEPAPYVTLPHALVQIQDEISRRECDPAAKSRRV